MSSGRSRPRDRRDRRGRGLRGQLVPANVPLARSRMERFDDVVLDTMRGLGEHLAGELGPVDLMVEEVPDVDQLARDVVRYGSYLVEDGDVPLAQLRPGRRDRQGATTPPLIIVYRRPLETRAHDPAELADLVHDVMVEEVAHLLGRDPEDIDPF